MPDGIALLPSWGTAVDQALDCHGQVAQPEPALEECPAPTSIEQQCLALILECTPPEHTEIGLAASVAKDPIAYYQQEVQNLDKNLDRIFAFAQAAPEHLMKPLAKAYFDIDYVKRKHLVHCFHLKHELESGYLTMEEVRDRLNGKERFFHLTVGIQGGRTAGMRDHRDFAAVVQDSLLPSDWKARCPRSTCDVQSLPPSPPASTSFVASNQQPRLNWDNLKIAAPQNGNNGVGALLKSWVRWW